MNAFEYFKMGYASTFGVVVVHYRVPADYASVLAVQLMQFHES